MDNQLDPSVVNLAKAIRQSESGGNFNAPVGKAGERGAYQFTKDTWNASASKYGITTPIEQSTPEQQNAVAYNRIKEWKDKGHDVTQIASMWNAGQGEPNAYTGKFSDGSPSTMKNPDGTIKFDVPSYAGRVATEYQKLKAAGGQSTGTQNTGGYPTAPDWTQNTGGYPTAPEVKPFEPAQKPEEKKGIVQKGLEFLFPILEKKERTGLQTAGDIGMSVLPFVPGLGQLGLLSKGARALGLASKASKTAGVVEGMLSANAAGKFVPKLGEKLVESATTKAPGLISRIASSPVAQATATGYATGASKNLSEGKSVGESIAPNFNTLGGAVLGGGAGLLAKGVGRIINRATGIPENIKPRLSNLTNPNLYDEYANVGARRSQDIANPSMIQHGVERASKAVDSILKSLKTVGKEVNSLKSFEGAKKLGNTSSLVTDFSKEIQRFGISVKISPTGKITFNNLPGRMKNVLSGADKSRLRGVVSDLLKLNKGGNVRKASDVLDNLDSAIDYGKAQKFAGATDPLNGFLKETRHSLNEVIGRTSSTLAKAKTRATDLNKVINFLKSEGGNNFQRADLLLKRALTGDKGAIPREVFDIIKKETGVNLMDDAVLINHFTRSMGGEAQSLLEQYLQRAAQGAGGVTIPDLMIQGVQKGLMSTVADPIKAGRRLVEGKGPMIKGLLQRGIPEAVALKAGQLLSQ